MPGDDPHLRTVGQGGSPEIAARALRTPRSAALAGIAFSLLLTVALVFMRVAIPEMPSQAGQWLSDPAHRNAVLAVLGLVPFAGIAFLWFIGVVRDRVGVAEDRFFATVFLGSGLLFIAMLFASAATADSLVTYAGQNGPSQVASNLWSLGRQLTHALIDVAMRMSAVFTIAGSTILRRTGAGPRWLGAMGYVVGLILLVTSSFYAWVELLFPLWVLVVSLHILLASFRTARTVQTGATPTD
jgi:hypothetical protein